MTAPADQGARAAPAEPGAPLPAPRTAWATSLLAIVEREALRFLGQRGRFFAALVRPLVWLLVFAAGFRAALGLSITPPYVTYIEYETYIVPGLCGMILLFNGMQSSLSLVYDREMGSMRLLLTAPQPRWWLLFSKLAAGTCISILQAYAFLAIAAAFGIVMPWAGYLLVLPALFVGGLMLGALGLALSSLVKQLENFAGVMNFVIFPMFFLSTALYPLWRMAESSALLRDICAANPFTHAVELIRFALYGQINLPALGWTLLAAAAFGALALWGYDPARGMARTRI
jgi:ABC-2 type transport system permease protein